MFQMPSYEMLLLIFMGVETILFENSVLKMYLLNTCTHLNFQINSFLIVSSYFICFIEQFVGSK